MANAQAMCTSFKVEILDAVHDLSMDVIKAALFLASASQGAATTAYSATGEVSGTNYSAGGVTATTATAPTSTGTTAFWTPSASLVYTNVTLSIAFDAVLLYNSSKSNKAISVHTFGAQTITAGTLTLTMPTNDATTGLLRVA